MTPEAALGVRLARKAGPGRAATVIACTAAGVFVLVLVTHLPEASVQHPNLAGEVRYAKLLCLFVALPVVFLISTVSRLSSDTRDRRLATLRILGASPGMAARVAVAETLSLVGTGAVLGGACSYAFFGPLARTALAHGWIVRIPPFDARVALLAVAAVCLGAAAAAVRPALADSALSLRQARPVTRRRTLRIGLVAGATGLLLAAVSLTRGGDPKAIGLIVGSIVLTACGAPAMVDLVVQRLADLLRRSSRPTAMVSAARLRADRSGTGRALSALVVSVFVAVVALCIFTAWLTTPEYTTAKWATTHPVTVLATADDPAALTSVAADLRRVEGVTAVQTAAGFEEIGTHTTRRAVSLSCAQVAKIAHVEGCSDKHPWSVHRSGATTPTSPRLVHLRSGSHSVTATATGVGTVQLLTPAQQWGYDWLSNDTVIVPPAALGPLGIRPNAVLITVEPGSRALYDLEFSPDKPVSFGLPTDWAFYDQVQAQRKLILTVIAAVLATALISVTVATLDLLAERRRRVASLRMLGVPAGNLRRAQFAATSIPVLTGLLITSAAGVLCGQGYLSFAGYPNAVPWSDVLSLGALMTVLGLALAAATTAGLGRPLTADLIRRE